MAPHGVPHPVTQEVTATKSTEPHPRAGWATLWGVLGRHSRGIIGNEPMTHDKGGEAQPVQDEAPVKSRVKKERAPKGSKIKIVTMDIPESIRAKFGLSPRVHPPLEPERRSDTESPRDEMEGGRQHDGRGEFPGPLELFMAQHGRPGDPYRRDGPGGGPGMPLPRFPGSHGPMEHFSVEDPSMLRRFGDPGYPGGRTPGMPVPIDSLGPVNPPPGRHGALDPFEPVDPLGEVDPELGARRDRVPGSSGPLPGDRGAANRLGPREEQLLRRQEEKLRGVREEDWDDEAKWAARLLLPRKAQSTAGEDTTLGGQAKPETPEPLGPEEHRQIDSIVASFFARQKPRGRQEK
eukprot:jgi/Mesvir1/9384/Mv09834-RA.1